MTNRVVTRTLLNDFATRRARYWIKVFGKSPLLRRLGANAEAFVDLAIVSKKVMQELNEEYRGKPGPTDILSFPAEEIFRNQGILGELVVCAPVLLKQAKDREITWKQEVDVLIVHGLLHLLGFDHEAGLEQLAQMLKWERKILGPRAGLIERAQEPTLKSKWQPKRKKTSQSRRTKSASR